MSPPARVNGLTTDADSESSSGPNVVWPTCFADGWSSCIAVPTAERPRVRVENCLRVFERATGFLVLLRDCPPPNKFRCVFIGRDPVQLMGFPKVWGPFAL